MRKVKIPIVFLLCFLTISIYAKKINKSYSKNIKLKVDGIDKEWTSQNLIKSINKFPENAKKDYENAYAIALYADNNSQDIFFAVRYLNNFDFMFSKSKTTGTAGELYIKKTNGKIGFDNYDFVAHLPYGFFD